MPDSLQLAFAIETAGILVARAITVFAAVLAAGLLAAVWQ